MLTPVIYTNPCIILNWLTSVYNLNRKWSDLFFLVYELNKKHCILYWNFIYLFHPNCVCLPSAESDHTRSTAVGEIEFNNASTWKSTRRTELPASNSSSSTHAVKLRARGSKVLNDNLKALSEAQSSTVRSKFSLSLSCS